MKTKKILVVDDDPGILDALSVILEDSGYQVNATPRGEDTLSRTASFHPDLILLDVLLSGSDGRQICRQLKSDSATSHIPVIMISAHPSAGQSIRRVGADSFIPKPFDSQDLLSEISKFI